MTGSKALKIFQWVLDIKIMATSLKRVDVEEHFKMLWINISEETKCTDQGMSCIIPLTLDASGQWHVAMSLNKF